MRCVLVKPKPAAKKLSAQTGAVFRPPRIQNLTTTLGAHSGAEPMSALALDLAWLKSAFHGYRYT